MIIDAFGKQCPAPLVMAKKEIDKGNHDFSIKVDNETSVKNVSRMATKKGLAVNVKAIDGGFELAFSEPAEGYEAPDLSSVLGQGGTVASGSGFAVFVSKDHLGEGDPVLGRNLIKMAVYTLAEGDDVPVSLLFMNSGVKLLAGDGAEQEVVDNVKKLAERGCEVLVCGTCLNYYKIADGLKAGEVSNMYDILERMHEASKVITL